MAPREPVTPPRAMKIPEIMITAATPCAATSSPVVARAQTLTRSTARIDLAAALAEDGPVLDDDIMDAPPSSPTPPKTYHPTGSPSEASTRHLSVPQKPSYLKKSPIRMYILSDFAASRNPFNLKVRNENTGRDRFDIAANEIRVLAQCYGESMVWIMKVEEVFCERCVEEAKVRNEKDYRTYVHEFLDKNPDILQAYLRLRGRHNPGSCTHNNGVSELMRSVGHQDSTRIKSLLLTTFRPNTFQNADKVSSAIGIIIQSFPNLQHATINLSSQRSLSSPSPSSSSGADTFPPSDPSSGSDKRQQRALITDGVAVKLARAFALLEKQLPEGEGLDVKGLEEQPVLMERWRAVRRGWWERRGSFGRKVLR